MPRPSALLQVCRASCRVRRFALPAGGVGAARIRDPNRTDRVNTMELTFLGTASSLPQAGRNQQALTLRMSGELWLFDCGEATQRQLLRAAISPMKIRRLFVSHMHGDHIFGIPSLLCSLYANESGFAKGTRRQVQVVGPEGIRSWIRAALGNSYASLHGLQLEIHELSGMRAMARHRNRPAVHVSRPLPNELPVEPIAPCEDGTWRIPPMEHGPPATVRAVELAHSVPTVGWIVEEESRPGALHAHKIHPILQARATPRRAHAAAAHRAGVSR